ncbi:MAG: magnesium transporter [Lachnospiraceae bacterium]|nr:magnesium transporter [Lachnospiraceae bacterium]
MEELKDIIDELVNLLDCGKIYSAKECLSNLNEADIAAVLEEIPPKYLVKAFRILPKGIAADTFSFLDSDTQETLIKAFSDKELRDVINDLFMDDTVDLLEEMPASVIKRILKHTDPQTRQIINEIMNYPEDSAGSIMTTEYISLKKNMTVEQSFERIRAIAIDKETIYTCYVTNEQSVLQGIVTVKDLLLAQYTDTIGDIMETNIISVNTLEDKENVVHMFDKYDFLAMPVVDKENRLVGIVTFDDAMEVLQDENTEDIEKMAAIMPTDKPYMKTSVFETFKKRIPWLLLLMISATFTGTIIKHYEDALGTYVVLTAFIPMLMDTAGNAGSQASVTIIRGLSLNEIEFKDIFKIQGKEFLVALCCGTTLALANFVKLITLDGLAMNIAFVVCGTLLLVVIVAKFVGCSLPIIAKKIGFDPAVMASPFITTIVDAISLLVYFQIASHVLGI